MYRGKRAKGWNIKSGVLFASLVLLIVLTVGTTVAFLMDDTNTVENTFQPAQVSCKIHETFTDAKEKTNVYVENTSNVDAYIRAEILVNWVKAGTDKVVPVVPDGYSYTLNLNSTDWTEEQPDGFYYYETSVDPKAFTKELVNSASPVYPEGITIATAPYHLQVTILAEAIQADGLGAASAQDAWDKAKGVQP